jgi:hemerythrin
MTTEIERLGWIDPFVHEHESLHQTLGELRTLLENRESTAKVAIALAEFANQVQAHFVHEEEPEGFFDSVIDQAPRLKTRADALLEEHAAMSRELKELRRHAKHGVVSDEWWSQLNTEFESFWRLFCRHERSEHELVQEAFHDDIGSKD